MSDDDKNERAKELERRLRGDAGGNLEKTLTAMTDTTEKLGAAFDSLSKRVDAFEARRDDGRRKDRRDDDDAKRDDDLAFDNLPDEEREKLISLQEEKQPGQAKATVADSTRTAYDEMVRGETRHERERRRESLRFDVMARADAVFSELGLRCPPPSALESLTVYRHRLAKALARYSPSYKQVDIGALTGRALDTCEAVVYADSRQFAKAPTDVMPGQLRKVEKRQPGGHTIIEWYGSPAGWMNAFSGPVQLRATGSFRTPSGGSWGE